MRGRVAATDGWSLCVCAFVVLLRWCVWCGAQAVSLAVPARVCVYCILLLGSSSAWWRRDISVRGCVAATDGWSLCVCAFVVLLRWCAWCGAQKLVSLAVPALVCVFVYCFWDPHQLGGGEISACATVWLRLTDGACVCVCAFVVLLRWCVWCGAQKRVSLAVLALVCV
eukprot:COSAG06_NODE_304_length_17855_cov_47.399414_4_plen_169_part_00